MSPWRPAHPSYPPAGQADLRPRRGVQLGYFRPAGLIEVAAGTDGDGRLSFWEFHNWNSGSSGIQTRYVVPNQRVEFPAADSPLRLVAGEDYTLETVGGTPLSRIFLAWRA